MKIPKRFRLVDDTKKIMKQGSSNVISIPRIIFNGLGLVKGQSVKIYADGEGRIMIDFNGDE